MDVLEVLSLDIDTIVERLRLGLDLFGPYADVLWTVPAFWAVAATAIWLHAGWQQRRSDRAYLDYASRNLSLFRRIARQRAREVSHGRPYDRF